MKTLTIEQKTLLRHLVLEYCQIDPSLVSVVIDAATEGVKKFASNQKEGINQLSFILSNVLEKHKDDEFGNFSRKDILEAIRPCLGGTPWHTKQVKSLSQI